MIYDALNWNSLLTVIMILSNSLLFHDTNIDNKLLLHKIIYYVIKLPTSSVIKLQVYKNTIFLKMLYYFLYIWHLRIK